VSLLSGEDIPEGGDISMRYTVLVINLRDEAGVRLILTGKNVPKPAFTDYKWAISACIINGNGFDRPPAMIRPTKSIGKLTAPAWRKHPTAPMIAPNMIVRFRLM
jgi:hypothetical protein